MDTLGNPAFDSLAIRSSRITPDQSIDIYRIGKSLRRKGFTAASLDDPSRLADTVNEHLAGWVDAGGAVRIERDAPGLSSRRTWVCELPGAQTNIPCGGTHIHNLNELAGVTATLSRTDVDGGLELTMMTTTSRV